MVPVNPQLGVDLLLVPPTRAAAMLGVRVLCVGMSLTWPLWAWHLDNCPFFSTSPSTKAIPSLPYAAMYLGPQRLSAFQKLLSYSKENFFKNHPEMLILPLNLIVYFPFKHTHTHTTTSFLVLLPFIHEFQCFDAWPLLSAESSCPANEPVSLKWKQTPPSYVATTSLTSH